MENPAPRFTSTGIKTPKVKVVAHMLIKPTTAVVVGVEFMVPKGTPQKEIEEKIAASARDMWVRHDSIRSAVEVTMKRVSVEE